MYEQVSRGCFIQLVFGLAASLKFNSVHWQSLLWLSVESISILIFIFHLLSTLSSTQNYLILYCRCATSLSVCCYQRISVPIVNFIYYGNYFSSTVWILLLILWILKCLVDCGYYLFQAERLRRGDGAREAAATPRPSNWATFTPSQKSMWRRRNKSVGYVGRSGNLRGCQSPNDSASQHMIYGNSQGLGRRGGLRRSA